MVPLAGGRQRALLAVLLVHANEVVDTDRLIEALWGTEPPKTARAALQGYVTQLRRLLPPERLATQAGGYTVSVEPGELDLDRFEELVAAARTLDPAEAATTLRAALALWRGPALLDFRNEHFAQREVMRLEELRLAAVEQRIEADLALVRHDELVAAARTLDPAEAATMLRAALALWRGPALLDFRNEHFAQREVLRLEELRLAAVEQRIEADLALGRHDELVSELEGLTAEHPFRERLAGQLMLALYRSGRQADALRAYQRARRALVNELGIEPGPALRAVEKQILTQDAELEAAPAAEEAPVERPSRDGVPHDEVRPVTVLFADIVGSSGLGERLAPDEVKALIGECVTMMSRAVEEYGGTVQAYQGDGICAYFGVPTAHEDDHERAARAALRILEVVGEYAEDVEGAWGVTGFDVRIGVNTGRAAVGSVGAGNPQTVALGDATNLAARLESLAAHGTIAVGPETARRLAPRFLLEPLGEVTVKGREAPVAASRLVRARAREQDGGRPFLVGRDEEVARLSGVFDELASGRGRVVLLAGEAGIGKTRLLEELRSLAGERVTWLEGRCLSYGGPATWPFMEILLGWLGADVGEPKIALRTKARARLGPLLGSSVDDVLPALGRLLRLGLETDGAGDDVTGAYLRWLKALAAERPLVVVLEDVHWADTPTRELAERVLELTDEAPLALVMSREPVVDSEGARLRMRALGDFGHRTTELALHPLSDEAAGRLLAALLPGEATLEEGTRRGLLREAEGNPLYLEELARAHAEGGAPAPRGRTWTVTLRSTELMPPALENLLVARIDRLPENARRLAQTAAAVGRTFPVAVLEAVVGDGVREDLTTLLRAEIVCEVRRYPTFECSFTHGLLHDAALSTLTSARARALYAEIARAFEALYADSLEEHYERLAHYHAQAGNLPQALEYAGRARAT